MSKTLFVGDSHTCGYFMSDGSHKECDSALSTLDDIYKWANNNYAEYYSEQNNKEVIIYSMQGATNCKYVDWIGYCLRKYDIDEIFVQSTYWNRYKIAASFSKEIDIQIEVPLGHFIMDHLPRNNEQNELVIRLSDDEESLEAAEIVRQPLLEDYKSFKGHKFNKEGEYIYETTLTDNYTKTKLWNELVTHIQHRNYVKDLLVIDNLCRFHNVPWHLFNMNINQYIPPNLDFYTPLTNCKRAPVSVKDFLEQTQGIDSKDYLIDVEHFNEEYHKLIAKHYIPFLKKIA